MSLLDALFGQSGIKNAETDLAVEQANQTLLDLKLQREVISRKARERQAEQDRINLANEDERRLLEALSRPAVRAALREALNLPDQKLAGAE